MRAARLHELGGLPRVDEIPAPDGQVLAVTSSTLNPIDIAIGSGRFYGGSPEPPYVIGSEAVAVASDERRYWYYGRGAIAEHVAVDDETQLVELPDAVSDGLALACGIAGLTGAARRVDAVPDVADAAIPIDGELPPADVVIDPVWGDAAERALAAAPSGVRFVQLGQSGGATATLQSAWVRGKFASVLGQTFGAVRPRSARAA